VQLLCQASINGDSTAAAGCLLCFFFCAVGECQGPEQQLQEMRQWLCEEGSPYSHIEACNISSERKLQQREFEVFERRKNVP
jgi:hypothetical protein